MGYRSQLIIGIEKNQYVECALITQTIPKLLQEYQPRAWGDVMYWAIPDIKWYDDFPDVVECEEFFEMLNDLPYKDEQSFGAIRIGEDDDDTQEWGTPHQFEIYVRRDICCPLT